MAYPILAPNSSWFVPNVSTVKRANITEIEIMDSYTPDASVTVIDSWDASTAKNGSITCYVIGTKVIIAGNRSGKISLSADASYTFSDASKKSYFTALNNISGISLLDTSNATNIKNMFSNCQKLTTLNLSSFDTSKVQNMQAMFLQCVNLESVDLSNWNTSNTTVMAGMFGNCLKLKALNLSHFDTSKVTTFLQFAAVCESLEVVDAPNFITSSCNNMKAMFANCFKLNSIDVTNWDTSNVTDMNGMFINCSSLTELNVQNWNTSKVSTIASIVEDCANLSTLDVSGWNISSCIDMYCAFNGCSSLTNLDMSNWNPSSCTNMSFMFYECSNLKEIDVSNWDTSKVTTMKSMFSSCSKLSGLNVSKWNLSSCTDLSFMFWGASSIKEIDVSNWDVSKVQNFDHFAAHALLRRKGIENWDTSSAINMNAMFHNCAEEELDLSDFKTDKVQFFSQMFENSPNLKRIKGLDKWDTSNAVGFDEMFGRCYKLEELDLSSWDTSKAKNGVEASTNGHTTGTFRNFCNDCQNLKWIKFGPNFAINGDGTNTTAEYKLILPTTNSAYIDGADGNWYTFIGDAFAPNAIKDKTAETYYASYDMVADMDVIVKNGSLINAAKAIREKNGTTDHYTPAQFGAAIRAL